MGRIGSQTHWLRVVYTERLINASYFAERNIIQRLPLAQRRYVGFERSVAEYPYPSNQ